MAEAKGPVSVQCPQCKESFPVPCEQIGQDGHQVIMRLDRSDVYGHMQSCTGGDVKPPTKAVAKTGDTKGSPLVAPTTAAGFVAPGKRACTMCGQENQECMGRLTRSAKACCPACENGSTHPVPRGDMPCAEWATLHGGPKS